MSTPTATLPTKPWRQKMLERAVGIRQAERCLDMSRLEREARLVRRLVRKTQDGTLNKETDEPEDTEEDDRVHIGDITIIGDSNLVSEEAQRQTPINADVTPKEPSPQPQPQPSQPRPTERTPKASFARRMLPYALAAAIGTGAGAAVMNLIQPDTTDRDTQYQLELVE